MFQRIVAIIFICLLQFQVFSANTVFAGDSTSFNPVPITVTAKSAGGGVPVGTIIAWPVAKNPEDMENWLECNGQSINASVYPELAAMVGGRVPDLRGLFLRGVGGNAAPLGQQQGDAIRNITGYIHEYKGTEVGSTGGAFSMSSFGWSSNTGHAGYASGPDNNTYSFDASLQVPTAEENRPVNKSVRYLIKAQ